jgi:peptidoglycan-associated lipoprotein
MKKSSLSPIFGVFSGTIGLFVVGLVLSLSGCKPDYPTCDTDQDCKEKEFCVNRKCQQCRDNADCAEGQACNAGKCGAIAGFCRDKSQCPAGQECIANRCRACASDTECPSGLKCVQGSCQKPQCTKDDDCAQDQECQNGMCVAARKQASTGALCPLAPVYFGFDQSSLNNESSGALQQNADCLKKHDKPVNLVGRADPRGTPEYNLALSDKRAQAVREYLQRLGIPANRLVPVPRGELDASGTDDAGWAKDRRVDSEWQ